MEGIYMKRIVAIFICVLTLFGTITIPTVFADEEKEYTSGYFRYVVDNNYAHITKYTGSEKNVVIPAKINGIKVESVRYDAFQKSSDKIKSVVVSEGIKYVTSWNFGVNWSIEKVTLPSTIENIQGGLFSISGPNLKEIKFSKPHKQYKVIDGVVYDIKNNYLIMCPQTKKFKNGKYTVRKGTKVIESYAFHDNKYLKELQMPNTVTDIYEVVFSGCYNLRKINFSPRIKQVGRISFAECKNLKSVTIPKTVKGLLQEGVDPDFIMLGYEYNKSGYGYHKIPGFTVKGYKGSEAEKFAKQNGFKFVTVKPTITTKVKTLVIGKKEQFNLSSKIKVNKKGKLSWHCSNKSIATVSSKGVVIGKKYGTTVVTVSNKYGTKINIKVIVKNAPKKIVLSPKTLTLGKGESATIKRLFGKNEFSNKVTWATSNKKVASFKKVTSANVKLYGKKSGTTTITAKAFNGKKATCKVKVIDRNAYFFKSMVTYNGKTYFNMKNATIYKNKKITLLPGNIRKIATLFTIKDNYIYYQTFTSKGEGRVYRCNMNGKNNKLIATKCESNIYILFNKLYYCCTDKNNSLVNKVVNLKTNKTEKLPKNYEYSNTIYKGMGYFVKDNSVYSYNYQNHKLKQITSTDNPYSLSVSYIFGASNNNLYFYSANDSSVGYGIGKVNISSGKTEFVYKASMEEFCIPKGNYLFANVSFSDKPRIYKYNVSTKKDQLLKEYTVKNFNFSSIYDGDRYILLSINHYTQNTNYNDLYMISYDGKYSARIARYK